MHSNWRVEAWFAYATSTSMGFAPPRLAPCRLPSTTDRPAALTRARAARQRLQTVLSRAVQKTAVASSRKPGKLTLVSLSTFGRRASSAALCFLFAAGVTYCTASLESVEGDSSGDSGAGFGSQAGSANPYAPGAGLGGSSEATEGTGAGAPALTMPNTSPASGAGGRGYSMAPPDRSCTTFSVASERVVPSVLVVMASSATMATPFGTTGMSRWTALRNAVLTLAQNIQQSARVGVLVVGGTNGTSGTTDLGSAAPQGAGGGFGSARGAGAGGAPGATYTQNAATSCPNTLRVLPAINNTVAMARVIPAAPWNQPHSALAEGVQSGAALLAAQGNDGPTYMVLALDADVAGCTATDANTAHSNVVRGVEASFQKAIRTKVLGISNDINDVRLTQLANAGAGTAIDGAATPGLFYRATDSSGLERAVAGLTAAFSSRCALKLGNAVDVGQASIATVSLNQQPLALNDANGWTLNSSTELELRGSACDRLSSAQLSIVFPCSAILQK